MNYSRRLSQNQSGSNPSSQWNTLTFVGDQLFKPPTDIQDKQEYFSSPQNNFKALTLIRVLRAWNEQQKTTQLNLGREKIPQMLMLQNQTSSFPNQQVVQLSDEVQEHFRNLHKKLDDEKSLYENAQAIVAWIEETEQEYECQTIIAALLESLPVLSSHILLATLNNAEILIVNFDLLNVVSYLLGSENKRVAQSAATYLLVCGGELGERLFQAKLDSGTLPHSPLIQGISKLLC